MSVEITLADVGLTERSTAVLDTAQVTRIAATLDAPVPGPADPLPALWHWAFFSPTTPTAGLGGDGHPALAPALVTHPRRMWGAGRIEWGGDLRAGAVAERTSAVTSVRSTTGASGSLLIVVLEHEYHQDGDARLREEQTLVYRDALTARAPLPVERDAPPVPAGVWVQIRRPAPPLLFRFSAITFNSHRIHYDLSYAREVEGYPNLVVHGPLTAMSIAAFVEERTGHRLAAFDFKATAPMFVDQPCTIVCQPPGPGASTGTATAVRADGVVAMQVLYRLRD